MMERSDGEQKPAAGGISGQDVDPKPDADGNKGGENGSGTRSKKSVRWSEELVMESTYSPTSETSPSYGSATANGGGGSNPYVSTAPASSSSYSTTLKDSVSTVRDVLGRWGKKVGEATKKAENLAGNTWQHLKTAPSFADAAMGRIAQGTKVLAEAGPVMGVLYISTAKLAFCSDNPLSYKAGDKDEWSYYKVVIPLHQLKAVNPSTSRANPAEKFIQVISVDNHEFWYLSFLNYDGAVKCLRDALDARNLFV
ncbi:hypothetical protein Vadar_013243 [Vaccinium darrowii]|uniref:Uncharacterized protein n=1 Tax=Vaccinium darrowii TaxID=229202 RepID=A0ACB7Z3M3_9ERIC|nr:hypothetical protein Vadar_013243 [Vaccinium darrowii]